MLERKYLKPALLSAAFCAAVGVAIASAQIAPPLFLYGSIADEAGPVPAGLPVEAYIGDVLCGTGETELMGEGAGQVTFYYLQVWSDEDRPGCGTPEAEVELHIGDRRAPETVAWQGRAIEFNITFGDVEPAPIPTFTPTPGPTETPSPAATQPATTRVPESPVPTIRGGVTSATPESASIVVRDSTTEGFPLWIAVVIVLGGVGVLGGGLGFAMSRNQDNDDDLFD